MDGDQCATNCPEIKWGSTVTEEEAWQLILSVRSFGNSK
jgi:hypothetical protein